MNSLVQQVSLTKEDVSTLHKGIARHEDAVHKEMAQHEEELKEVKKVLSAIQGDMAKYQQDLKAELTTMKTTILQSVKDTLTSTKKTTL